MGSLISSIRSMDPDDVFSYYTIKLVVVRDRYLGLLYYGLVAVIFIYVVFIVLLHQKQYLEYEAPIGTVAKYLKAPTEPLRTDRPYCKSKGKGKGGCRVMDVSEMQPQPLLNGAIVITTQVHEEKQQLACKPDAVVCAAKYAKLEGEEADYFVADVEKHVVVLQHSFQARRFFKESGGDPAFAGSNKHLYGELVRYDSSNDAKEKAADSYIPFVSPSSSHRRVIRRFEVGKYDELSVGEIVDAAGHDLDALRAVPLTATMGQSNSITPSTLRPQQRSVRERGIILVLTIEYIPQSSGQVHYEITVGAIPNTKFTFSEVDRIDDEHRVFRLQHGVQILFVQAGFISRFELQNMLIQSATALGLISMATLIVDILMQYFLPLRAHYIDAKYENSIDFSDLKAGLEDKNKNKDNKDKEREIVARAPDDSRFKLTRASQRSARLAPSTDVVRS